MEKLFMPFVSKLLRRGNSLGWAVLLLMALLLLTLPLRWLATVVCSMAVHEFFHWIALKICGERLFGISLSIRGVTMHTAPLSHGKQLFCALAGPVGGLILVVFCHHMPRLALCSLFHSGYNLLPVYPLDGGRALSSLLEMLCPTRSAVVQRWVQRICVWTLVSACLWASFVQKLGPVPVMMASFLLLKVNSEQGVSLSLQK